MKQHIRFVCIVLVFIACGCALRVLLITGNRAETLEEMPLDDQRQIAMDARLADLARRRELMSQYMKARESGDTDEVERLRVIVEEASSNRRDMMKAIRQSESARRLELLSQWTEARKAGDEKRARKIQSELSNSDRAIRRSSLGY